MKPESENGRSIRSRQGHRTVELDLQDVPLILPDELTNPRAVVPDGSASHAQCRADFLVTPTCSIGMQQIKPKKSPSSPEFTINAWVGSALSEMTFGSEPSPRVVSDADTPSTLPLRTSSCSLGILVAPPL